MVVSNNEISARKNKTWTWGIERIWTNAFETPEKPCSGKTYSRQDFEATKMK
jgi:hypothetical protein